MWLRKYQTTRRFETAEALLRSCELVASFDGTLRIRPTGPTLSYPELHAILRRIRPDRAGRRFDEVIFDFDAIQAITAPWTLLVALLIDFARQTKVHCRIVSLRGQPAAIARFLRIAELLSLLQTHEGSGVTSAEADSPGNEGGFLPTNGSVSQMKLDGPRPVEAPSDEPPQEGHAFDTSKLPKGDPGGLNPIFVNGIPLSRRKKNSDSCKNYPPSRDWSLNASGFADEASHLEAFR